MNKIAILTDSTADLPLEYIKENNIYAVPLYVNINGEYFKDKIEISTEEIIEYNRKDNDVMAKTSAPSPIDYQNTFEKIKEDGYEKVICITVSEPLSATYQICKMMSEDLDIENIVIDTKSVSGGEGVVVAYAVDLVKEGRDFSDIVANIKRVLENKKLYIRFDTLKYLKAGGRLGKTAVKVATLLDVKPIIDVDDAGKLEIVKLKRNEKRAKKDMANYVNDALKNAKKYYLSYLYVEDENNINELKELTKDVYENAIEALTSQLGSVVSVHIGMKGFGIAYLIVD